MLRLSPLWALAWLLLPGAATTIRRRKTRLWSPRLRPAPQAPPVRPALPEPLAAPGPRVRLVLRVRLAHRVLPGHRERPAHPERPAPRAPRAAQAVQAAQERQAVQAAADSQVAYAFSSFKPQAKHVYAGRSAPFSAKEEGALLCLGCACLPEQAFFCYNTPKENMCMAVKPTPKTPSVKLSASKPAARQPRPPQGTRAARPKPPRSNERFVHDLGGVGLLAFAGLLLASLALERHAGLLGTPLAHSLRAFVGIGAWVVPFLIGAIGVMLIVGREQHTRANFAGGALGLFLTIIAWTQLAHSPHADPLFHHARYGGWVGGEISSALRAAVGDVGGQIILLALGIGAVLWATDMRLLHLVGHVVAGGKRVAAPVRQGARAAAQGAKAASESARQNAAALKETAKERADAREANRAAPRLTPPWDGEKMAPPPPILGELDKNMRAGAGESNGKAPVSDREPNGKVVASSGKPLGLSLTPPELAPSREASIAGSRAGEPSSPLPAHDAPTVPQALPPIVQAMPTPPKPAEPLVIPALLGDDGTKHEYVLPPFTLLKESPPPPVHHESAAREKQAVLMQTLNDFKIGANVAQVAMGPTVTRYEVQLEPGILVKKIVALADNLAMSLAAIDVRVEAPIPGKAAIGIEVPNDVTQMVSLRECLETNEFMNAPSKLTFALGKDVSGEYKYADLTRMPHLLVGGSTNSGKSVCLNTIISSILYRATPREVKFVMIDPKRVELSLYDGIPHLLAPVVKNVKQAAGIFRSCLKEMEDRYDAFARLGTRNIEGYNSRVAPDDRLPFIVLVVDELADLMMQQGPEVETSICRLAQLARATGIHLVIATQRPSVDVITGTIKANISSRIAFAVATQVDSRTIIDMPGADRLIGRGDMLFMPIDAAKPIRVQGCYIGERETEGLVTYLKEQEEVHYTMIPSEAGDGTMGNAGGDDDGSSDELFEPAVRWLVMQGQCSTSSIQRKFKIGYTRSARLVEFMEAQGIVGSQDGIKPREVLLRPENVDVWFAGQGQGDLGQG